MSLEYALGIEERPVVAAVVACRLLLLRVGARGGGALCVGLLAVFGLRAHVGRRGPCARRLVRMRLRALTELVVVLQVTCEKNNRCEWLKEQDICPTKGVWGCKETFLCAAVDVAKDTMPFVLWCSTV